jgi:hypothetical protein
VGVLGIGWTLRDEVTEVRVLGRVRDWIGE